MKRIIWNELLEWKQAKGRKPLIISGARQVGKTWIMREFGKQEYEDCLYVNCDDEPRIAKLFDQDYDIDRILLGLQAITGIMARAGKTLIILDEIQEIPRGLASLKYFCEKAPEQHVIVAGSLLGIALHENTSFPVGKVDMLYMYPMNFMEFMNAAGHADWETMIRHGEWKIIDVIADKLKELLRQYYYVGGMPAVVACFMEEHNLAKVRIMQESIINAYRQDISKHAPKIEIPRINMVFRSISSQLAKENKKFIYGVIKKGARANDFELAIQWLMDCGIVYKVNRTKSAKIPLSFYEDLSSFKLFLLDCGLLAAMAGAPADQMLIGNHVFEEFKGAFTEQYVMQQLKTIHGLRIYYWSSEAMSEIDFLVQQGSKILPIEVKAEENLRARSLRQFIKDNPEWHGIRFSMSTQRDQDWVTNYPLYALSAAFDNPSRKMPLHLHE